MLFLDDTFENVEDENALSNIASTVISTDSESVDFDDIIKIGIIYNNIQCFFCYYKLLN